MKDKVSVIIPTFNRALTLSRAVDSVLNQSYGNLEIIVIDDGSTDNTQEILKNYPQIQIITQENSGVSAARNSGVKIASGTWISFLDSDDVWLTQKIEMQLEYLKGNPQFKWVYTDEIWIRNGVRVNKKKKHQKAGGDQFIPSLDQCLIGPSSVVIHNTLFKTYTFREDFPVCEDYDLWLKLLVTNPIGFISTPLIEKYGGHTDQLSTKYFAMDLYRLKSIAWVLKNMDLTESVSQYAKDVFKQKLSILKNGAIKHSNYNLLSEIAVLENIYIF